jgi:integrase
VARQINRLSSRTVATVKTPGLHADGLGLYLRVDKPRANIVTGEDNTGSKRWAFIFQWRGKRTEMGLGSVSTFDLKEARAMALEARKLVAKGINPIEARKAGGVDAPTFGTVADELLASLADGWRNDKHQAQWKTSLEVHAKPLRAKAVDAVTTEDVLEVLKPLWAVTPESASRVRGRIERVLDAAKAKGWRLGENPARWRGHLALLLPKRQKLQRGHHAAMPFADAPAFFADLKGRPAVAARGLEWTILAAARTGETTGATFREIDFAAKVWTVPAERMKAGKEHRVPMTPRMVEIAVAQREAAKLLGRNTNPLDELIFPGASAGKGMSNMAMTMLLRRMEAEKVTVHGFRSTFRDWAGETTDFPREVVEAALAHAVGDAVELAYRRGDALLKRRKLMEAWASYLSGRRAAPS